MEYFPNNANGLISGSYQNWTVLMFCTEEDTAILVSRKCCGRRSATSISGKEMKSRIAFRILAPLALLACAGSASASTLVVTKSAYCGCCKHWVEHMKKAGFTVEVRDVEDVMPTARRLGVPDNLRYCHTSTIGGYVIEGHVPATDVKRLLAAKPRATGITGPGMVVGSPGMEQGGQKETYKVVLFDKSGKTRVFASH
jgi:hypothetical protein